MCSGILNFLFGRGVSEASKATAQRHGDHELEAGAMSPGRPAGLQPPHLRRALHRRYGAGW